MGYSPGDEETGGLGYDGSEPEDHGDSDDFEASIQAAHQHNTFAGHKASQQDPTGDSPEIANFRRVGIHPVQVPVGDLPEYHPDLNLDLGVSKEVALSREHYEPGGGLLPVAPGNAELSLPVQRGSEVVEDNLGRPCRVRRIIILYWRGALHNLSRFGLASTLILTLIEWRTGRG